MSGSAAPPDLTTSSNGIGVVPDTLLNTFLQSGALLADLRAFNNALSKMVVYMIGTITPGDGGQGLFIWNSASTTADDGGVTAIQPNGLVFGRWLRQSGAGASIVAIANIAALRALSTGANPVWVEGYYTAGDGGEGMFNTGPSASDNGGTIIVSANGTYYRDTMGSDYNGLWFGILADSSTDNLVLLQAAVSAAIAVGRALHIPGSEDSYNLSDRVAITGPIKIYGDGTGQGPGAGTTAFGTRLLSTAALSGVFSIATPRSVQIEDLQCGTTVPSTGSAVVVAGSGGVVNGNSRFRNLAFVGTGIGLDFQSAAFWTTDSCYFQECPIDGISIINNTNNDAGDNNITSCIFFNDENGTQDAGVRYYNGGALFIRGCKFLGGQTGFRMTYTGAPTGTILITNSSFEQYAVSAIKLEKTGSQPFGNIVINGNEFSTAGVVTPQSTIGILMGDTPWIDNIVIGGNVFNMGTMDAAHPLIDLEDGLYGHIQGNVFNLGSTNGLVAVRLAGNAANWTIGSNRWVAGGSGCVKYQTALSTVTIDERDGIPFADLPNPANGSLVWVPDGTPTNPLTGSGTGCLALRVTSIWVGIIAP